MNITSEEAEKVKNYLQIALLDENVELELLFKNNRISKNDFDRVFKTLSSNLQFISRPEELDIRLSDKLYDLRTTIVGLTNIKLYCKTNDLRGIEYKMIRKNKFIRSEKKKMEAIFINDYDFKINIKNESDIEKTNDKHIEFLANSKKSLKTYRLKKRFSFITKDNLFRFDLTIVKSSNKNIDSKMIPTSNLIKSNIFKNKKEYEIELEFIGNNESDEITNDDILKSLLYNCNIVLQALQDTDCIISKTKEKDIVKSYIALTFADINTTDKKFRFDRKYFIGPQPITLEMDNIRNFKQDTNIISINHQYSVTDKADGERNLLYIDNSGKIFLINQKMEIRYTGLSSNLTKCIMDGEHIKYDKNNNLLSRSLFGVFDIYFYNGHDIRNKVLYTGDESLDNARYNILKNIFNNIIDIKNDISNNGINIFLKEFEFCMDESQSIFKKSEFILKKFEGEHGHNYYIDGLIYTPINYAVCENKEGEINYSEYKNKNSGVTWNRVFKWKPPEDNSIDFLVEFENEINEKGKKIDKISFEYNETNTVRYKTGILKVGMSLKDKLSFNICKSLYSSIKVDNKSYIFTEFKPTNITGDNTFKTKIYIYDGDKAYCENDKSEIIHGNIVEFVYDIHKNNWKPIRTRFDKVRPNDFKVANSNWASINNPISKEMISSGNDIPDISESDELYWTGSKSNIEYDKYTKNMRNFHNLIIKNNLIVNVPNLFHEETDEINLLELGCGKGGDLNRWRYGNYTKILALDSNKIALEDPNDGACMRYHNLVRKHKNKQPKTIFVYADCTKNIKNGEAGKNSENEELLGSLFGSKDKTKINKDVRNVYNMFSKFQVISSQFSLHYFVQNEEYLTSFIENISENISKGGYFIGTTFDGFKVFNMLKDVEINQHISGIVDKKLIWKITKKYDYIEYVPENNYSIDIYYGSIGITNTEYLVNFDHLVKKFSEYGMNLISDEEANKIGFDMASDTFDNHSKYNKEYKMSDIEKQYSRLNRWFVFQKQ